MKKIDVVAAIIMYENKILCVQRGVSKYDYVSKKFEFPGGKVELNETLEEAIVREIREELNMVVSPDEFFFTVKHQYPDFFITMHSFICSCDDPAVQLLEHLDYKWLDASSLKTLDWAAADIPIVDKLMESTQDADR